MSRSKDLWGDLSVKGPLGQTTPEVIFVYNKTLPGCYYCGPAICISLSLRRMRSVHKLPQRSFCPPEVILPRGHFTARTLLKYAKHNKIWNTVEQGIPSPM